MSEPGTIGRYRLLGEIGRGAAGVVYRAEDPLGRPVALKLLQVAAASERQRRRFQNEVRALLRIRHPHVVGLLDAGTTRGLPYLVMEWVEGETLQARLTREGPLPAREAAALVERLAEAVGRCHAEGVLHRDLKPANVLLRRADGAPLVADFGLAKQIGIEGTQPSLGVRTAEGAPLGTPGFWAPEQARGELDLVGPPADVYALGATLYAALTGRSPFQGRDLIGLYEAMETLPPPPGSLAPGTPAALDGICLRCLEPEPGRRYADAAQLAEALGAFLHGRAGARRGRRARRALLLLGPLGLLTGAGVWLASRPRPATGPLPASSTAAAETPQTKPPPAEPPLSEPDTQAPSVTAARAELARGLAARRAGRLDEARSALDHALELDPRSVDALEARGGLRTATGDPEGAEADFDRALELAPDRASLWHGRGISRGRRGQLTACLTDLDQALRLAPDLVPYLRDRAITRHRLQDERGAADDLERALAQVPADPDLRFNHGVALSCLGDHAGAARELELALRNGFPDQVTAWRYLAAEQVALDDVQGAVESYDRAVALGPITASLLRDRAAIRLRARDLQGALEDCARARELEPDRLDLAELEGRILLAGGRWRQALEVADRQLARAPEDVFAWYVRGVALFQLRDPRAEGALERFLELAPDHGEAPVVHDLLARLQGR